MKKLVLSLLLFGTFLSQSEAKIQGGVGITVGSASGRWNNEFLHAKLSSAGGTLNFQTGVHAGIQGRIWFNKFVGINLAAEFNMGGSRFNRVMGPGGSVVMKLAHKENQITIPLTAMVGWGNERLRIFLNGGGYFGYIISATDKSSTEISGTETQSSSGKADFKSDSAYLNFDAGVRVGGGIQVYVDKKLKQSVTFDVNYDFGLTHTFKGDHTPAYFNASDKVHLTSSKIMIGVGYIYNFGKSQAEEKPKRVFEEQP